MRKKLISILTTAVLIAGTSACAFAEDTVTADSLCKGWQDMASEADSFSADAKTDLDVSIKVAGEESSIEGAGDIRFRSRKDAASITGALEYSVSSPDGTETEEEEIETYVVPSETGAGYDVYSLKDGKWEHTTAETNDYRFDPAKIGDIADPVLSEDTVAIQSGGQNYTCYEVSGIIPLGNLTDLIQMPEGETEDAISADDLEEIQAEIPIKMYFDTETESLVRIETDAAGVIEEIIRQATSENNIMAVVPLLFQIDVPRFSFVIDNIALGGEEDIAVPEEMLKAAEKA